MKYIITIIAFLLIGCGTTSKELIVFTQSGCSRCEYTIDFLKNNHISYIEYSTDVEINNSKMWTMLEQTGNSGVENVTMPVIVRDNTSWYSIPDLEGFLEKYRQR